MISRFAILVVLVFMAFIQLIVGGHISDIRCLMYVKEFGDGMHQCLARKLEHDEAKKAIFGRV
jgi:hypothetical protein